MGLDTAKEKLSDVEGSFVEKPKMGKREMNR